MNSFSLHKKTKTSELLLIKYFKIKKLFAIESHTWRCDSVTKSFVILIYFISNNSLVLVFLFDIANTILFNFFFSLRFCCFGYRVIQMFSRNTFWEIASIHTILCKTEKDNLELFLQHLAKSNCNNGKVVWTVTMARLFGLHLGINIFSRVDKIGEYHNSVLALRMYDLIHYLIYL